MPKHPNRLAELAAGVGVEQSFMAEARELRSRMRRDLGDAKARKLWVAAGKVLPGPIPGKRRYDYDFLMELFDNLAGHPDCAEWKRENIANLIAKHVHTETPGKYGASVAAITKGITRALDARTKAAAERRKEFERFFAQWPSAFASPFPPGSYPEGLLGPPADPPDKIGGVAPIKPDMWRLMPTSRR